MRGLDLLTEFSKKAGEKLEPKNIKIDDTTLGMVSKLQESFLQMMKRYILQRCLTI